MTPPGKMITTLLVQIIVCRRAGAKSLFVLMRDQYIRDQHFDPSMDKLFYPLYNAGRIYLILLTLCHGPLARYVKLRVAHAPGMPGTFSPPPPVSDPDMHHVTCVTHVP